MHRIVLASFAVASLAAPSAASAATKTVDLGLPLKQQHKFQALGTDVNDFFPHGVSIHAGEGETSLMLDLYPDAVDMSKLSAKSWYAQSAARASREFGERGREAILSHLREVLR